MRLLLLHKYGRRAASFRYRFEQYLPYLERAGFACTVSSLLDESYLQARLTSGQRRYTAAARAALRQLRRLAQAHRYDGVILGLDLFPYVPALFERYLNLIGVPYIFDFDDPVFHYYDLSPSRLVRYALGKKIRRVAAGASLVYAGSPYLVDYVRAVNSRVEYLPTVVDLQKYPLKTGVGDERAKPFTIGWIGSPSTSVFLETIRPALARFCSRHQARLLLVGSGQVELPGVPTEIRPWSEEHEARDLHEFDVGIMPLTDIPWSRGKCGLKLIQCMAVGLPVVASPVGVNRDIVETGVNGFLAAGMPNWEEALERLAADPALAARLGGAGRAKVERQYCVQVLAPRFVEGVREAFETPTGSK